MSAVPSLRDRVSWVEPYLKSPWVELISVLAPTFPSPEADSDVWAKFYRHVLVGVGILASIGFVAALAVLVKSCISCRRPRPQARFPSTKPLFCTNCFTILLVALGVFAYWSLASSGVLDATSEIKDITADVKTVQAEGIALARIGNSVSATVNSTIHDCPAAWQQQLREQLQSQVEAYRGTVLQLNSEIEDLPRRLDNVTAALENLSSAGIWSFTLPLAVSCLCILAIVFVACVSRASHSSGRCSHCCIRWLGPLLFVPAILVVTACTAAEFSISLVTAAFCKDVDTNTVAYMKKYGTNTTYEVAMYYIEGTGSNPLLVDLAQAQEQLNNAKDEIIQFGDIIKQECNSPDAVDTLTKNLEDTLKLVSQVQQLLEPGHIYPYYQQAVHENACGTLISGVCWLVVVQTLVGLVCLPCLALGADSFFKRWRAAAAAQADVERQVMNARQA